MPACIYCKEISKLSKSHVIPECLGSKLKMYGHVCSDCNSIIGQSIEAKICKDFEFYRFIVQVHSKRKILIDSTLQILDRSINVRVGKGGIPKSIPPIVLDEKSQKKYFQVAESPDKLKKYIRDLKKQGIEFDESVVLPCDVRMTFSINYENINTIEYLRLVSKIAYERLCQINRLRIDGKEFDPLRKFIIEGEIPIEMAAFLFYEDKVIQRMLHLPFPFHGILIAGFNNKIVAVVTIFGLFYYFVILNKKAISLQEWIDYVYIEPRTGKHCMPILKTDYSLSKLLNLINASIRGSEVFEKSKYYARMKFNKYLQENGLMQSD